MSIYDMLCSGYGEVKKYIYTVYMLLSMSHALKLHFATLLVPGIEDVLIREYAGTGICIIGNNSK